LGYTVKLSTMALQKILLVDDDKSFLYLNRKMFKYNNVVCQIDECRNGQEALHYLSSTETLPDIILMDINMPVMDGLEFLKKYEQRPGHQDPPKVFILSSSNTEEEKSKALRYKFVKGYFEKPLNDAHIAEILSSFKDEKTEPKLRVLEPEG